MADLNGHHGLLNAVAHPVSGSAEQLLSPKQRAASRDVTGGEAAKVLGLEPSCESGRGQGEPGTLGPLPSVRVAGESPEERGWSGTLAGVFPPGNYCPHVRAPLTHSRLWDALLSSIFRGRFLPIYQRSLLQSTW